MAFSAYDYFMDEDKVNKVMGAAPLRGATWEQALAAAQYFGFRATLVSPCTLGQVKEWTDAGVPVMIAWNPEGREWSHASLIFDVDDDYVHIADPNCLDPNELTKKVPHADFYKKWLEKWDSYLVRRPAMAIEREITVDGKPTKLASYSGNPDEKSIYPKEIDHGYDEPVHGGSDVMQKLQDKLLEEQNFKFASRRVISRWLDHARL